MKNSLPPCLSSSRFFLTLLGLVWTHLGFALKQETPVWMNQPCSNSLSEQSSLHPLSSKVCGHLGAQIHRAGKEERDQKRTEKQLNRRIAYKHGMLEFEDRSALLNLYEYLTTQLKSYPVSNGLQTNSDPKTPVDYMKRNFKGFKPLVSYDLRDPAWRSNPVLAALLNSDQALKVDGEVFIFKGPYQLYHVANAPSQNRICKTIIQQRFKKALPSFVSTHILTERLLSDVFREQENPTRGARGDKVAASPVVEKVNTLQTSSDQDRASLKGKNTKEKPQKRRSSLFTIIMIPVIALIGMLVGFIGGLLASSIGITI